MATSNHISKQTFASDWKFFTLLFVILLPSVFLVIGNQSVAENFFALLCSMIPLPFLYSKGYTYFGGIKGFAIINIVAIGAAGFGRVIFNLVVALL